MLIYRNNLRLNKPTKIEIKAKRNLSKQETKSRQLRKQTKARY